MTNDSIRAIALYLPQYHPIAENNAWWGQGFTEWTNVAKAKPMYRGHYQPHLPADLGFYDLRLPEARQAQADLAREYGIHGFCYYHYWFNGQRLLERPFNDVLASKQPDFPFCLCWANENWTRTWDGLDKQVLMAQNYNSEDDVEHIKSLIPAFKDERYIRVNGKPLFLVYRTELMPDPKKTAQLWRETAAKHGIDDLYLVRVEKAQSGVSPEDVGFDAAMQFAPNTSLAGHPFLRRKRHDILHKLRIVPRLYVNNSIHSYDTIMSLMLGSKNPPYRRFAGVFPSWDNSARRSQGAIIFRGSSPEKYQNWLTEVVRRTKVIDNPDERLIFINAWNEWGEGCHLEPDQKYGRSYLEATKNALK